MIQSIAVKVLSYANRNEGEYLQQWNYEAQCISNRMRSNHIVPTIHLDFRRWKKTPLLIYRFMPYSKYGTLKDLQDKVRENPE